MSHTLTDFSFLPLPFLSMSFFHKKVLIRRKSRFCLIRQQSRESHITVQTLENGARTTKLTTKAQHRNAPRGIEIGRWRLRQREHVVQTSFVCFHFDFTGWVVQMNHHRHYQQWQQEQEVNLKTSAANCADN